MRKLVVTVVALAVLVPATALAGGWATVQLSSTPKGAKAGVPWVVNLTVLQHGVTPLENVQPHVRIEQGTARTAVPRPSDREDGRLPAPASSSRGREPGAGRSGTASPAHTPTRPSRSLRPRSDHKAVAARRLRRRGRLQGSAPPKAGISGGNPRKRIPASRASKLRRERSAATRRRRGVARRATAGPSWRSTASARAGRGTRDRSRRGGAPATSPSRSPCAARPRRARSRR